MKTNRTQSEATPPDGSPEPVDAEQRRRLDALPEDMRALVMEALRHIRATGTESEDPVAQAVQQVEADKSERRADAPERPGGEVH